MEIQQDLQKSQLFLIIDLFLLLQMIILDIQLLNYVNKRMIFLNQLQNIITLFQINLIFHQNKLDRIGVQSFQITNLINFIGKKVYSSNQHLGINHEVMEQLREQIVLQWKIQQNTLDVYCQIQVCLNNIGGKGCYKQLVLKICISIKFIKILIYKKLRINIFQLKLQSTRILSLWIYCIYKNTRLFKIKT
eukprot:TRINITY_DN5498_c0_g1_i2.p4 TRINITY_DN5498_c0_g1~~TRINITY_DN5498_c0_g1_i2.p4  ORF type:complete len:191 (-),score=-24.43 TRINITY_DN5498_c0_g1_i2:1797-2369(-)